MLRELFLALIFACRVFAVITVFFCIYIGISVVIDLV